MFRIERHWRQQGAIVVLVALALVAGTATAGTRNRTRSRAGATPVQTAPANEHLAVAPAAVEAIDPNQAAADIAEIRRAVGESPVDRVKDSENPFNAFAPENDYECPAGSPPLPVGDSVTVERGEIRIITQRGNEFTETVVGQPPQLSADATAAPAKVEARISSPKMELCDRLQAEAAISEVHRAVGNSSLNRSGSDASEYWLLHGMPRVFRSGYSRPEEPNGMPEKVSQLRAARDEEFQAALQRVLLATAKAQAMTAPAGVANSGDWPGNSVVQPPVGVKPTTDDLQSELRSLARKMETRAADMDDAREFADADKLRELAGTLRREARNMEPPEIFSFFISGGR